MRRRRSVASMICATTLGVAVGVVGVIGLNVDGASAFAVDNSEVVSERIAGATAPDTAAATAREAFPDGAKCAVVSSASDARFGLAASGLAGTVDGPSLVTWGDSLADGTKSAIGELGIERVYVIGGTDVVSQGVEDELKALGCTVERVAGSTAADTSAACANKIVELGGNPRGEVIVASADGITDVASIASYAYKYQVPVLYQQDSSLPAAAAAFGDAASRILVVGSDAAVSTDLVEGHDGAWSAKTLRMAGDDAYATSRTVAETLVSEGSLTQEVVGVTSGESDDSGVDAVAAAALCAKHDAPMIVTNASATSTTVNNYLVSQQDNTLAAYVIGDDESVSEDAYNYISRIVDGSIRFTAIIGSDQWQPSGYSFHMEGSDLQMLLATDAVSGKMWIVSVPRDTYYDTGRGKYKSNYVYHFAFYDAQAQGYSTKECQNIAARACANMMSDLFGVSVDHYLVTNLNDYGDLVNRLGGIGVNVPYTIDYDFYAMQNLSTGAYESPFSPIRINSGNQVLDGFTSTSLSRARTSNIGGLEYASYGLEQDATRQNVNRLQMVSLINRALTDSNVVNLIGPLVDLGLIDTDYNSDEVIELLSAFVQHNSVTVYASSGPVNGRIVEVPGDAPWLVPSDPLFYENIRNTILSGGDTAWLNDYYGVNYDSWFPLAWSMNLYPNTNQQQPGKFSDVYERGWYYECIQLGADLGFINGYSNGRFGPYDTLTRGQAACITANMAKADNSVSYSGQYPDIWGGEYYANNTAWAKNVGVMNGYQNGDFGPNDSLTREQVACTLFNYARVVLGQDTTVTDVEGALAAFPDAGDVDDWAREAVAWAVNNHIMGNGGFINPRADITRAEMTAMVTNLQPYSL